MGVSAPKVEKTSARVFWSGWCIPNCCQFCDFWKHVCIIYSVTQPPRLDWTRNEQMLVMDTHGQRPTSAIVFVITGPWHLTLGDTMCFVTVTRAMLLSSMWSKGPSLFQIFWCFFSPATFILSVSGPPISPQVPVQETLIQVKTQNNEIYHSSTNDYCVFNSPHRWII